MSGGLVLVGTPIGNLGDLSRRALETLAGADVLVCEDTRRTRQLLSHAGIRAKHLVAMDAHREVQSIDRILAWVRAGRTVALVTDAGMPAVSDPGARLVAALAAAGEQVRVVPGPSAVLAAVVLSGLPTDRFAFEGFLPRKGAERAQRLREVAGSAATTVIFEAPLRLGATLAHLAEACGGERRAAVARELTKLHEEVWRGRLDEAAELARIGSPRGEQVIVVAARPAASAPPDDDALARAVRAHLDQGKSARDSAHAAAVELDVPKRRAYAVALGLK